MKRASGEAKRKGANLLATGLLCGCSGDPPLHKIKRSENVWIRIPETSIAVLPALQQGQGEVILLRWRARGDLGRIQE
jgi:hypothetical protein